MVDRRAIGDLSLAILLALPLVALAASHSVVRKPLNTPSPVKVASADRGPTADRISLFG
jgi:hypothetical protein